MTLSPEQAAFVEAYPFALSSYITDDMQERIAERIKTTVYAEGHRRAMPASKQLTPAEQMVSAASIEKCLLALLAKSPMTRHQLRLATGIRGAKISSALENIHRRGDATRTKINGQRYVYSAVRA